MPKWKLDKLLNNYFFIAPVCDSTVTVQSIAIDSLRNALTKGQVLIDVRSEEIKALVFINDQWQLRFDNIQEIQKHDLKQAKKKGRKQGLTIGVALAVIGLLL